MQLCVREHVNAALQHLAVVQRSHALSGVTSHTRPNIISGASAVQTPFVMKHVSALQRQSQVRLMSSRSKS